MRTLACRSGSLGLALAAGVAAVIIVTATPASAQSIDDVEARLLELLNSERRAAGVEELERASDLVAIASDWSRVMAGTGKIRHNPDLEEQMCCFVQWAENVAYGAVPEGWLMESTEGVHRNLMRSTTHRDNILDPAFDQVGIGAVVADGILWVTQDFRRHAVPTRRAISPSEPASPPAPTPSHEPQPTRDPIPSPSPAEPPRPRATPPTTSEHVVNVRADVPQTAARVAGASEPPKRATIGVGHVAKMCSHCHVALLLAVAILLVLPLSVRTEPHRQPERGFSWPGSETRT